MQVGLIGAGNMARALARGWGRPVLCADPVGERARGARRRARRRGARRQRRGGAARRSGRALPQARAAAGRRRARSRRTPRPSRRSSPPRRCRRCATPIRASPSTASSPRCPSRCARAPSCRPPTPTTASRTDRELDRRAVAELFAELGTLVVLDDALVDVAMGLMSCAPGVCRARRRGAGRRGRAPRHPRRAGRRTGRADAVRHRRAAAPARL